MKGIYKYLIVFKKIILYSLGRASKYYQGNEKSGFRKFVDLTLHFFKTGEFNTMYYAFGLNLSGSKPSDFIGKKQLNRIVLKRNTSLRRNGTQANIRGYDILTGDKFYLSSILKSQGLPVVDNIGLVVQGQFIDRKGNVYPIEQVLQLQMPVLFKNTRLEYNEGLLLMEHDTDGFFVNKRKVSKQALLKHFSGQPWVVQDICRSSAEIRKINDTALNTTRIVTLFNQGRPQYLTGFQAFATNAELTDSWGKRAVYVGFDPVSQTLREYGFYHPYMKPDGITDHHPDSQVYFKGYRIPGLASAVKLCMDAHRYLYYTCLIGWDVAITDDGPKILEANEKPGMNAVQCVDGGLRNKLHAVKSS